MIFTMLCARRTAYLSRPETPETGMLNSLRKNAFAITRHFHPNQIALMDPVLQIHLRVGPPDGRHSK